MVFKLVMAAARTWRRLKGENQLPKVIDGVSFKDGVEVTTDDSHRTPPDRPSPKFRHSPCATWNALLAEPGRPRSLTSFPWLPTSITTS